MITLGRKSKEKQKRRGRRRDGLPAPRSFSVLQYFEKILPSVKGCDVL